MQQVQSDLFVARKNELNLFKDFIKPESSKRILIIHTEGVGGIGKTRLLLRMQDQCKRFQHVVCPDHPEEIIDFYHTVSRSKAGIMQQIVESLDSDDFSSFRKLLKRYHDIQKHGKKEVLLAELEERFSEDYARFSERKEAEGKVILLFFDTYEAIQGAAIEVDGKPEVGPTDFSHWLEASLFPALNRNTRLVIAGRYALRNIGQDVELINLSPFTPSEAEAFWTEYLQRHPENRLKDVIESGDLKKRLHHLAGGRPVLLALLLDWINYERNPLSPKELLDDIEKKTGPITSSATNEQKQIFEKTLIERIASLIEPEDTAVIYMAFVHRRMTPKIFCHLAGIDTDQSSQVLLETLKPLSFIKYKKDDVVLLHDEMRDLVNCHWWDEQDKDKENRRKIAEKLVKHYDDMLANSELSSLDREILSADRLYYALFADIDKGVKQFLKEFDYSLEHFRLDFCDLLLREISNDQFYGVLAPKAIIKVELRRIRWYNEQYRSQEALNVIEKLCDEVGKYEELLPEFIYECGIAYTWQNKFRKAERDFKDAERKFRTLKDYYSSAWALNWLGYAQLRNGEFEIAEKTLLYSISEFLKLSEQNRKPLIYVGISNAYSNLNVVFRHLGRFYEAINCGEIAVAIAEEKGNLRELIRYLHALAETCKTANKTFDALKTYNKARKLFKSVSDPLLKARVLTGMGLLSYHHNEYIYMLEYYDRGEEQREIFRKYREIYPPDMTKLNKAKDILESFHPTRELADIYFHLGESYAVNNDWEKAMKYYQQSEKTAKNVGNAYREMGALVAQMIACYYAGEKGLEKEGREPFEKEIRRCIIHISEIPHNYRNLSGKMRIVLGDFACEKYLFLESHDKLKEAVSHYILACDNMYMFNAERFYATMRILLKRLNKIFSDQSPSPETIKVIESLRDIWYYDLGDKEVCQKYREEFDDVLDCILIRIRAIEIDKDGHEKRIKGINEKVENCIRQGKDNIGFAPFYGEMYVLLQDAFGSPDEKAEAYHTLARAYRLTDNYFEALKNYEKALNISENSKNELLRVRILSGYAMNLYRRREYGRTIEQYRRDEIKENVTQFLKDNKDEIEEARKYFESADEIIQNIDGSYASQIDTVDWVRSGLEFHRGEFLLLIGEEIENLDIEKHFRTSIEKAKKANRMWLEAEAIQNLVTYYYFSGQWEKKKEDINKLYMGLTKLNESRYFPVLLARFSITAGDVVYDKLLKLFEEVRNDNITDEIKEKAINFMDKAFVSYILATRYQAEYSDKHFQEALRILLKRIAQLPKEAVRILSDELYHTRFLHLKRPVGPIADRAYQLVEQFIKIRSEVL
ncbi:tetratricopeptide repeat protein [Desulfobacterales bacterium HSG2]|nr:tetratricopeptide repeat protein [Desulfobacterales bacterium HSG2]